MRFEIVAHAKINLALHILGRRPDGFHEIDSLVVFADFGDRVVLTPNGAPKLKVRGQFARDVPSDASNLAARAASLAGAPDDIGIALHKNIPVGAGLGGGSADAAAVMTLLGQRFGCPVPNVDAVAELGADLPVCLTGRPARVTGIGDGTSPLSGMPRLPLVLVNPGVRLDTATVYGCLGTKFQPPLLPLPGELTRHSLCGWIGRHRNGLLNSAARLAPMILETLTVLTEQAGCRAAAMSGSGATCFGAFHTEQEAGLAAKAILRQRPEWWVRPTLTRNALNAASRVPGAERLVRAPDGEIRQP
ncbi:MAG: 4-(cytidine 5'-diphospho)-2-C-methyl-D-erythritol kinase [Rhodobacteraceae bacterium]|nr:4-(cytidine 5'-diphospho)-2-C-methyl-D-erythritol kinase [Paracoccaceae bacterium]